MVDTAAGSQQQCWGQCWCSAEFGPETRFFLQQQCAFVARTHIPTEAFQALERVVERVVGAVSLSREGISWEGGVF